MFRVLTSLFFGREEENPKDKCGEDVVDEEWLLINHPEALNDVNSEKDQVTELEDASSSRCPSNLPVDEQTEANIETDRMSEPELSVQSSSILSWPKALAKVTQVARVQRAQARGDRRDLASSYIHRQNYVRQRAQRHAFRTCSTYLHQPRHRNFNN